MPECTGNRCGRPTDLYLCADCEVELADMLTSLTTGGTITETIQQGRTASGRHWWIERDRRIPGLLQDLADAATGQTRFGGHNRRTTTEEAPLRFNSTARKRITEIRALLLEWTQHLAKHIGAAYVAMDPLDTTAYAQWLAHNAHALAGIEDIGHFHHQLRTLIGKAQRCVDCPPQPRFCGQCDTMMDRKMCGLALYAPRDAVEVTCPNRDCRTVHNIEKLYTRTLNSAEYKLFPREVLIGNQRTDSPERYTTGIMGELGEFVHWQTFNRWLREKRLKPRMYLRPNGRRGFYRQSDDDTPEYRLADLRKVKRQMDGKTGKAKAG